MNNTVIEIKDNILLYKSKKPSLSVLKDFSFNVNLWNIWLNIDHITLTLKDKKAFDSEVEWAISNNLNLIKKPGIYPYDYCEVDDGFDDSLSMYFCSIDVRDKGKVVIVAPRNENDATSKYLAKYSNKGIHHLGVEVQDIEKEIINWRKIGFLKLSNIVKDEGLTQVFLKNKEGQIIELLERSNNLQETFTCNNANKLRISENL